MRQLQLRQSARYLTGCVYADQAASDGINSLQGTIWTPCDFPAQLDQDLPITYGGYQSLKQHLLGKRVKTRDARVTDALLKSWGMTSWKQYVLDQYLSTY